MNVTVYFESTNGHVEAVVLGAPSFRAKGPTRDDALLSLRTEIQSRISVGELVSLEIPTPASGIASLAGKYATDESLAGIVDEIYRHRDRLKAEEFPE